VKLRILGCGTSFGVPRIGGDWGACDPLERRNRRRRASILVEHNETRLLVDTSPDLREQLLDAEIDNLDAVLWTHDHADHCHGIDDLRQLYHSRGKPIDGYSRQHTLDILRTRFSYVFQGEYGYPSLVTPHVLPHHINIAGISVRGVDQPHGPITSIGLRFDAGGCSIGYSTDASDMTEEMAHLFDGVDVWIVDALRRHPHPSHAHLSKTLEWVDAVRAKRTILTHMDASMDYRTLLEELPEGVEPAYDGMEIVL
jgi:phosphoribosyl 1,2-cyclic phosphate phosphodiesterase